MLRSRGVLLSCSLSSWTSLSESSSSCQCLNQWVNASSGHGLWFIPLWRVSESFAPGAQSSWSRMRFIHFSVGGNFESVSQTWGYSFPHDWNRFTACYLCQCLNQESQVCSVNIYLISVSVSKSFGHEVPVSRSASKLRRRWCYFSGLTCRRGEATAGCWLHNAGDK